MTDLIARPPNQVPGPAPVADQPRPAVVGGLLAAGWAALAGALACAAVAVVGWFATSGGTAQGAVRVGVDAWLLAHRVPVELSDGTLSLAPLGLSVVPLVVLYRAGGWISRTSAVRGPADVAAGTATLAVGYGALAGLVGLFTRIDGAEPDVLWAFLLPAAAAGVAGGSGLVRTSGYGGRLWRALPEEVRAASYGGLIALGALLTGGALLLGLSLVGHLGRAISLAEGLGAGIVGHVLLLLLGSAYVPNAVVFAASFALGPGFAVGQGTVVAPTAVDLGPLPSFPLLAALPVGESPPGWVMGVLAIPFAAGALAGVVTVRRYPVYTVDAAALRGGLAGLLGGVGFAACAGLAGGSAGPGRLAVVGPAALQVGAVAVVTLALAGALAATVPRAWVFWQARRSRDAAARPSGDHEGSSVP